MEDFEKHTGQHDEVLKELLSDEPVIYLTGKAGTGKTTILREYQQKERRRLVTLAPTGAAAIIAGGKTIHRFFGFPPGAPASHTGPRGDKRFFQNIDVLAIDEASMVRADMMDAIDKFLRNNGPSPVKPFGGVLLRLVGDLYQLPPVVREKVERRYLDRRYANPFFFSAKVFEATGGMKTIELNEVYRQEDAVFIEILNAIRHNNISEEMLATLNRTCQTEISEDEYDGAIVLTPTNWRADLINDHWMSRIEGEPISYFGEAHGKVAEQQKLAPQKLRLKLGAQVMFVKNDMHGRWVNGTMGQVTKLEDDNVEVRITDAGRNETYIVEPVEWSVNDYELNETTGDLFSDIVGRYKQLPLRAAWAITIHKSQGKSFDRVIVDLGGRAFAPGQAYVALSRCRTLGGLTLTTPITMEDIMVDDAIVQFHEDQFTS